MRGVYLLHFDPPYKHAGHYLGYADDIGRRVYEHEISGSGAKLVDAARKAGVNMLLARVWPEKDRNFERKLKGRQRKDDGTVTAHTGSLRRLCPICHPGLEFNQIIGVLKHEISKPLQGALSGRPLHEGTRTCESVASEPSEAGRV